MIIKDINKEIEKLKTRPATHWEKKGEKMILNLFHNMATRVPAYKDFLKKNKINHQKIKTINDLKSIPLISKDNYLREYNYFDLFFDGKISPADTFSATSGSTGESFYFPRGKEHDAKYEYIAEIFLNNQFEINKKSTLVIMGFALGIWIGGIFTYKVFNRISEKGYHLTMIPVGTNKDQFLKVIKKFGYLYDQIILSGYPPFIKDVIDSGDEYNINWQDYKIKILTAAEGFSENFRDYISKKLFLKNSVNDIVNMYGTVELGTMANETVMTNLIKKISKENKSIFQKIFPKATIMPTLAQYYPNIIYFEEINGEIVASGEGSSIPFIRYKFSDLGGVISYEEMIKRLNNCGINIVRECEKYNINNKILRLPFVYLYARSDFAIIFRGANVYPEEIKNVLDNKYLSKFITGKFTIIKKEDEKMNQLLEINIELRKGIKGHKEISKNILKAIIKELCANNSEFNNEYTSHPNRTTPVVKLWPYQYYEHFSVSGKQKWVK